MSRRNLVLGLVVVCLAIGVAQGASSGAFINFDIPGANRIIPVGINNNRDVTGWYMTATATRAFIRKGNGTLITINVPGAVGTTPTAINNGGQIVGTYFPLGGVGYHGFVRSRAGQYTTLEVPGTNTQYPYTVPLSINDAGMVSGFDYDANGLEHAFIWDPSLGYTIVDVPGATFTAGSYINQQGEIAGSYNGSSSFVRSPSGAITTFEVNNLVTLVTGINRSGSVGGYYNPNGLHNSFCQQFLRNPSGDVVTFALPDCYTGTTPTGLDNAGDIIGIYYSTVGSTGIAHGYRRTASGTITYFDDPAAGKGNNGAGTLPLTISGSGNIAGYYYDSNQVSHGFILTE